MNNHNYTAEDRTPYVYVLEHIQSNRYYIGVRWRKDCQPKELLSKRGYKTSSNLVKN